MDVVNKIVQGDTTLSVTIVRAGPDAEKFIVNDETFKALLEKQWRKVNNEKELKKLEDEKFIAANYPGLNALPDGLRYKILIPGKGNVPADSSVLKISYTGKTGEWVDFCKFGE